LIHDLNEVAELVAGRASNDDLAEVTGSALVKAEAWGLAELPIMTPPRPVQIVGVASTAGDNEAHRNASLLRAVRGVARVQVPIVPARQLRCLHERSALRVLADEPPRELVDLDSQAFVGVVLVARRWPKKRAIVTQRPL